MLRVGPHADQSGIHANRIRAQRRQRAEAERLDRRQLQQSRLRCRLPLLRGAEVGVEQAGRVSGGGEPGAHLLRREPRRFEAPADRVGEAGVLEGRLLQRLLRLSGGRQRGILGHSGCRSAEQCAQHEGDIGKGERSPRRYHHQQRSPQGLKGGKPVKCCLTNVTSRC